MGASSWSPNSTDLHLNIYLLCKYRNLKDTAGQSARKRPERLVTLIRFFVLWAPQLFSQFYKIIYTMNNLLAANTFNNAYLLAATNNFWATNTVLATM